MSKITDLVFNGKNHYITSPFGYRKSFQTKAGATSSFHSGTDYGTNNQSIEQYAIADGYCFASAKATDGAYYVWLIYPQYKKAFIHYHLKSQSPLVPCQKVKKGTLIGYTGMSGKATGIHLHLGIRDLSKLPNLDIQAMTWSKLSSCPYIDPEIYAKTFAENPIKTNNSPKSYLSRGYIKLGDRSEFIGRIASFMRRTFPAYTPASALGNYYGPNICGAIKEFQRRTGLVPDGNIGPLTLAKLVEFGFKES